MEKQRKVKSIFLQLTEQNLLDEHGKPIKGITSITPYLGGIVVMTRDAVYSTVSLFSLKKK